MNKKKRVAILFGGKSAEHEVSIQSAKNVFNAIDKNKYDVVLMGVDKKGRWYLNEDAEWFLNAEDCKLIKLNKASEDLKLVPCIETGQLVGLSKNKKMRPIDVVFPLIHGSFGEDGTIQGLLKLMEVPFVGASVLGSAVGMDKDVMKRLLRDAGILIAKFISIKNTDKDNISFEKIESRLGLPVFVKPANLGSSVGISKVNGKEDYDKALKIAFGYDNKVIVEEQIDGREIECSVLGNDDPIASLPGEILPQGEFYSYNAKYIDKNGAKFEIPAKLTQELIEEIQECAKKVFKTLCCEGMARVDFFLKDNGDIVVNEINTIPGFTKISMYPKLWKESGISYSELIDRLIELAIDRFENEQRFKVDVS